MKDQDPPGIPDLRQVSPADLGKCDDGEFMDYCSPLLADLAQESSQVVGRNS